MAGLTLFAASSFAFLAGNTFLFFTLLMGLSGVAIAVFKTAALALIGDISTSATQHTAIMNTAEGFFGIGSIVGPALLARLLGAGVDWQWLYVLAGGICVLLIITALQIDYPRRARPAETRGGMTGPLAAMKNWYVLAFSIGIFLYVAVEAAVYVWMPTWLAPSGTPAASGRFPGLRAAIRSRASRRTVRWMADRISSERYVRFPPWMRRRTSTR